MSLETDNPEKGQLLRRSEQHREMFEAEVKQITERSEKMITNALIIGGALAAAYLLLRGFSGSGENKRKGKSSRTAHGGHTEEAEGMEAPPQTPGILSHVGSMLAAQAAGLLLSMAREKLVEYLESTRKETQS